MSSVPDERAPTTESGASIVGLGTRTSTVSDASPKPAAVTAVTVTVYEAPLMSPFSVHDMVDVLQSDLETVDADGDDADTL